MTDYYQRLGIPRDADADTVKRAYRKLAMKYHPDRNDEPDAAERFKEVTAAYEILSDPERRGLYDRYGESGIKRGAGAAGGFGRFDFADAVEVFMREFGGMGGLGDIFGRPGAPSRGPRRGSDLRLRLKVTLAEASTGVERSVKVNVLDICSRCKGQGAEPGTEPTTCSTCGGSGEVRQVQRSMLGQFVTVSPCPECRGAGQTISTVGSDAQHHAPGQTERR